MKPHLKLLQQVADIGAILAIRALFPWEGPYNDQEPEQMSTIAEGDGRAIYLPDGDEALITATMHGDTVVLGRDLRQHMPTDLRYAFAAMGLDADASHMGSVDADALHDRVMSLDSAWVLLRRLRQFTQDEPTVLASAYTLLNAAKNWHQHRMRAFNQPETPALEREGEEQLARLRQFQSWRVPGLQDIRIRGDVRGSALGLTFEGYDYAMELAPLSMDWAVGRLESAAAAPAKFGKYDVRPTRVDPKVQGVLNDLVISDCKVKITAKLPKALYAKVNELLELLGGQWNTAAQAHVFAEDPTVLIDGLIESGTVYLDKDFEFFATPQALGARVIKPLRLQPGMKVLEPNGGGGALALLAAQVVGLDNVTCYELMPRNVQRLRALGFKVGEPTDFLTVEPQPVFDAIVMNPPFSGFRDVAHIRHAMKFLKPGGVLSAIASTQWQTHSTRPAQEFRDYLQQAGAVVEMIPAGAFKESGTDVATTHIVIAKPKLASQPPAAAPAQPKIEEAQACLF